MKSNLSKKLLDKPYLVWALLFIIAPLVMVLYYALTDKTGAFTFDNFAQIGNYLPTILESILYGLVATVICLVIGYPFAYFLSKHTQRTQRTIVLLVMLPMWMNFLIRTYSLMTILGDSGVIINFLNSLHINTENIHLINTKGAVILGMVYNFLPYMILPIYTVMVKIDNRLIEAAHDLGCNNFSVMTKVILPLSISGVVSGVTMVFVPSISTFYISQKLGGGNFDLIGDTIERQFQTAYNYNLGAAISLILMVLILISMAVMNRFSDGDEGGMVV